MLASLPLDVTAIIVAMTGTGRMNGLSKAGAPVMAPELARRVAGLHVAPFRATRDGSHESLALQTLEWFAVTGAGCLSTDFPREMDPDVVRRCVTYDPESVVRANFTASTVVAWLLWASRWCHEEWFVSAVCVRISATNRIWDAMLDVFAVVAYAAHDVFRVCLELVAHLPHPPGMRHVEWFAERSTATAILLRAAHNVHATNEPDAIVGDGVRSLELLEAVAVVAPRSPRDLTDIIQSMLYEKEHKQTCNDDDIDAQQRAIHDYYNSQIHEKRPATPPPVERKRPCNKVAEPHADRVDRVSFVLLPDQETWMCGWFAPQVSFEGTAMRFKDVAVPANKALKMLFAVDTGGALTLLCEAPRPVVEDVRAGFASGDPESKTTPHLVIEAPLVALVVVGTGGVESVTFF